MSGQPDALAEQVSDRLLDLRVALKDYLDDVQADWYPMLSKEDFIERVRIALDDLDESELGAMYDQYVKEDDGEDS
jgi:hypothetical protein